MTGRGQGDAHLLWAKNQARESGSRYSCTNMSQTRMYSTADKNHRSVCHDVDILHSRVFLLLAAYCKADGRQENLVGRAGAHLVAK